MTPASIISWTFMGAQAAIPAVIFAPGVLTRQVISGVGRQFRADYRTINLPYRANQAKALYYRGAFCAAALNPKREEGRLAEIGKKRRRAKAVVKRLKEPRKKIIKERPIANVSGAVVSCVIASATLSGVKAEINFEDDHTEITCIHSRHAEWFNLKGLNLPFGLGHSNIDPIFDVKYSAENGFEWGKHGVLDYNHYPALAKSFTRTAVIGAAGYGATYGLVALWHNGTRSRRRQSRAVKARQSAKIAFCLAIPAAYLHANGLSLDPDFEIKKHSIEIGGKIDYNGQSAIIEFGNMPSLLSLDGTVNEYEVTRGHLEIHESKGFDWEGSISSKLKKSFAEKDKEKTEQMLDFVDAIIPWDIGAEAIKDALQYELKPAA